MTTDHDPYFCRTFSSSWNNIRHVNKFATNLSGIFSQYVNQYKGYTPSSIHRILCISSYESPSMYLIFCTSFYASHNLRSILNIYLYALCPVLYILIIVETC